MKTIVIGIMPQEKLRERILAIARGEYEPKPGEQKVWFTSMKSLAEVLSDENRALLKGTTSEPRIDFRLGRGHRSQAGNLSRTPITMSNYGIAEMRREKRRVRVRGCDAAPSDRLDAY